MLRKLILGATVPVATTVLPPNYIIVAVTPE
jgi:hypothetical protein